MIVPYPNLKTNSYRRPMSYRKFARRHYGKDIQFILYYVQIHRDIYVNTSLAGIHF